MRVPLFYSDRPVFGVDVGSRSAKVVQLVPTSRHGARVVGYGHANFPPDTIVEGIIADPEKLAGALKPLLDHLTQGKIKPQSRAAACLPVAKVFTRQLNLPPMSNEDLSQAIQFEAEQYVPVPVTDLYIDHQIIERPGAKPGENIDVLMVAAPRSIVDSYIKLFDLLELELFSIEPSLTAIARAMMSTRSTSHPSLVMDLGSLSTDLTIYDQVVRLTGTIGVGGDMLTNTLAKDLGITADQANEIKYKFGIKPSGLQPKILSALTPQLTTMVNELKRVTKFYKERSDKQEAVESIILTGGGADLPGLAEYLQEQVSLPVSIGNPWADLAIDPLQSPSKLDAASYTTAIGLAWLGVKHD